MQIDKNMKSGHQESQKMVGLWNFEITNTENGEVRTIEEYNIIPTVGKAAFAAQFNNARSPLRNIGDNLFIALGDDNTTPTAGDVALGNETQRKAVGSAASLSNVASIAVFFASGEATGTHEEFGLFGDGNTTQASASLNSGIIFSHVTSTISVSSVETLTVTFTLTFV